MAVASQEQIVWHTEVLPRSTKKALDALSRQRWLKRSAWYLAGGTALALQVGHRSSVDLDFFTEQKKFNNTSLLSHFLSGKAWETVINQEGTIYGEFHKAKISFIANPLFHLRQAARYYGFIRVVHPLDIAVMKIIAISQRGRKRDYIDLYWFAKNLEPLEKTIYRLNDQYPSVAHDYHHILKSLVYFDDAESDPMPKLYFRITWPEVKKFFAKEVSRITKEIIHLP